MALIVQKYGGSSLASPRHIQRAAARIKQTKSTGKDLVVVVSAMGRMTDHLIALAKRTVQKPPQREMDMLMTSGERISMALLAMALHESGVPAISFTGSQSGIVTSSHHTEAKILKIHGHRIQEELKKGKVVIVAGFQGVSLEKEITTLGRGGSDTTAVALAAVLGAEFCEILTDVDGLFSANPKLVPKANLLAHCSYDEALELASLGAKMHSRSIEVARRFRVKVRIGSSFNTGQGGTWLDSEAKTKRQSTENAMEETIIRAVATKEGFHFFKAALRFAELARLARDYHLPLRFFSFANGEVSFLCEKERTEAVRDGLNQLGANWEEQKKVSVVSLVGEGLSGSGEALGEVFQLLEATGIRAFLISSNSLSISVAIPSDQSEVFTQKLHALVVP